MNLTKPSGRMVAGSVQVNAIMSGLVLQWYFSLKRLSGCGGKNCHVAEVLCCNFIFFCYVESGTFLYIEG